MDLRQEFAALLVTKDAGTSGKFYTTDLAPNFDEVRCAHCPSYIRTEPVAVLALVRPRWRYDNAGNRTRRPNVVDFQPVCHDHDGTDYVNGRNNPPKRPVTVGRLRRSAR